MLVINTGNGAVVTFTAQNDGSLSGSMPASAVDRLLITITDPLGRTTSLQRSAFVAADGTTAVGAGPSRDITATCSMWLRGASSAVTVD